MGGFLITGAAAAIAATAGSGGEQAEKPAVRKTRKARADKPTEEELATAAEPENETEHHALDSTA